MAVSAKREATTRKSARATPRFDDSFEGRSIELGPLWKKNLRGWWRRGGGSTTRLPPLKGLPGQAPGQQGPPLDPARGGLPSARFEPPGALRVEEPRTRADAADLLRGKGDEDQRAHVSMAGEVLGDSAHALDAGCIVDDARAPPDGVVVGRDDDRLLALTAQLGDDVAFRQAGHEPPTHAHACENAFSLAQPGRVLAGDEDRRPDRNLARAGQERDRGAAEGGHQQPRELTAVLVLDREDVRLGEEPADRVRAQPAHSALDGAVGRVRVDAGAGVPALAFDFELRLVCFVAEHAELMESGLEPGIAEGVGHGLGGPVRGRRSGLADADLEPERLDEVHV